jgi:hypothetical protein
VALGAPAKHTTSTLVAIASGVRIGIVPRTTYILQVKGYASVRYV